MEHTDVWPANGALIALVTAETCCWHYFFCLGVWCQSRRENILWLFWAVYLLVGKRSAKKTWFYLTSKKILCIYIYTQRFIGFLDFFMWTDWNAAEFAFNGISWLWPSERQLLTCIIVSHAIGKWFLARTQFLHGHRLIRHCHLSNQQQRRQHGQVTCFDVMSSEYIQNAVSSLEQPWNYQDLPMYLSVCLKNKFCENSTSFLLSPECLDICISQSAWLILTEPARFFWLHQIMRWSFHAGPKGGIVDQRLQLCEVNFETQANY